MQNVSQYVQPQGCKSVNIQAGVPSVGHMTVPVAVVPTMVLNNGCYPAAYYLNSFATPAIAKLNQAALANQMININKENEKAQNINTPKEQTKVQEKPKEEQQVQTNPIKSEMAIPKELVSALESIAKNTSPASKPKMELTDHYVKNLESYLNSQDSKLRLMAGQDVIARLQEDSERKTNPALVALTNKMLQDPDLSVRSLSLAALESKIVLPDEITVNLLNGIAKKQNQDSISANKILMRMS